MFVVDKTLWRDEAPECLCCGLEIHPSNYKVWTIKNKITGQPIDLYFHTECLPKTEEEFQKYFKKKKGK